MSAHLAYTDHGSLAAELRRFRRRLGVRTQAERAGRFEEMVARALSRVFYLPLFDADSDPGGVLAHVRWYGSKLTWGKASPGPDGVVHAHGFCVVIEATQRRGATQWTHEFAQCVRHAEDVAKQMHMRPHDVLTVLVAEPVHADTFRSLKVSNQREALKVVPLMPRVLANVVETSAMAYTITHLEIRGLLDQLILVVSDAPDLQGFHRRVLDVTGAWQSKALANEKRPIVAIRAYEAMRRMRRQPVAASELYRKLRNDDALRQYLAAAGSSLAPDLIAESLEYEGLGAVFVRMPNDVLFRPVPLAGFRSRCDRRLRAVEATHVTL